MCNTKTMTTQKAIRGILLEEKLEGQGNLLARVESFLVGKEEKDSQQVTSQKTLLIFSELSTKKKKKSTIKRQ